MMDSTGQHHGNDVDRFIAKFSKQDDISYLYFTHDAQSGFTTHKKEKI